MTKDNPHKGMILMSMWVTPDEYEELMDKLNNMPMLHLVGDGLTAYLSIVDLIRGVHQRGDLRK
jgi:hypothetical protein